MYTILLLIHSIIYCVCIRNKMLTKKEGKTSYLKGIICYRGRVATAALLVIAFVLHPRDTRVIAAICTGGQ